MVDAGIAVPFTSVNISGLHFRRGRILKPLEKVLNETGIDPGLLELEITEGVLMEDVVDILPTLESIRSMGVNILVDDFGTGFSSLAYLKRFPVTGLKVDRSFVMDITSDTDDAVITRTIIGLAHDLGLKVIAEGVETKAQLDFLRGEGCDEGQGYYLYRPMPPEEVIRLLREENGMAADENTGRREAVRLLEQGGDEGI